MPPADPQALAEAVRDAMLERDHATRALGMRITHIAPGAAEIEMEVRADMLNGHGSCHGGLITALADSAFAFACNSRNVVSVASGFSVDLLLPAMQGDRLAARCRELHCGGRLGVYDCEVFNQRGDKVAIFRGHSYALKGRTVLGGEPLAERPAATADAGEHR
ncbi:hydroxyphenylacetyl-CoA thioesterase PaaI [Piscinibacter sakaiensis]|uniref:hydroxyphenylacetyl-CoA thioesterase PaaI n=1 Tax=Piscinibacter sakaiensis TaxID=1547922 RepID=UPI003AB0FDEE